MHMGSGGNVQGGSFALLLPLGYGLVVSVCFAPLRMFLVSIFAFYALWCGLLPLWYKNQNLGFLRLLIIVPIRTVFGTGVVLLGLVVAVVSVRNFTGVVLGTGCIFE